MNGNINNNENEKQSIIYFKRYFPEVDIEKTITFFENNYGMKLEHIEDFEELKEYNNIENSTLDNTDIQHHITLGDVINYYLFVTHDNEEPKCEIVIILKKIYSSGFVEKIEYIVLFETNTSPKKKNNFNRVEYKKKTLINDFSKNNSISKLKTYRIENYETITYLPENIKLLDEIVLNVNNGCFDSNCTLMGGKKSKRKLTRKSMRKSKKVKKSQKKSKKVKKSQKKSKKSKKVKKSQNN
jgi:hypothetical protein